MTREVRLTHGATAPIGHPEASVTGIDPSIGRRLEAHRKRRGLSRRTLAELVGRSQEWLRQVEKGLRPLDSIEVLTRIAEVLRIGDWSELLTARATPARRHDASAQPLVERLRRALCGQPPLAPPEGCAEPARGIGELWSCWRAPGRRFEVVAHHAAVALWRTGRGGPATDADRHDRVRALLLLHLVLSRLGERDLAYLAVHQAEQHCDAGAAPVLHACCQQARARELHRAGYPGGARDVVEAALDRLTGHATAGPERTGATIGLCLCAAEVEADLGNERAAEELLVRAEALLVRMGGSHPFGTDLDLLSPGPGAVGVVRVRSALALGKIELALHLAQEHKPGNNHPVDERVNHDIAMARVHAGRYDDVTALLTLLRVERVSPDDLRYDVTARDVVETLWHTTVPPVRAELAHLVERLHGT
ncbi:helix-turn-helix domain-containing protein [Saccharothrix xinjiangensis]|uniref:Helix-turn-helix domain-containing protein n=1 Tax=Saccharothrix xinjiangensis TaxID=204798 RepID=A0ABV9Y2H5_9PSEU